ncbi:MAG: pilus assembly protein N-terminal domain-containing protein [Litorimonas sp.]
MPLSRNSLVGALSRSSAMRGLCLSVFMLSIAPAALASDPIYQVDLNKTQILRLPAAAGSIIVGNPAIADVTVHSPHLIMVVGRGFGETNLVVLDREGGTMVDADIQVTSITPTNGLRLFKATSRETYSCSPYCQPSPVLGDSAEHLAAAAPATPANTGPTSIFDAVPNPVDSLGGGLEGAAAVAAYDGS